ncbi:MAG: shikimate kinase [Thermodesulfobacteriota bacterium]|nr:shikimate kinase [Thermodesulfobacteriota bacterium]
MQRGDVNLVLIGYRATGKTVVGRALSERLGRPFFDADAYIEKKAGRTIKEMVAAEGWPFFRAREKEAIRQLSAMEDCVIAPGGGAVMDRDNVALLRNKGWFVLLKADMDTMIQRIQGDKKSSEQRPDLLGGDIYEETQTMLKARMPVYEEVSDISVDTSHLSIDEVVERILEHFQREQLMGRSYGR